MRDVVAETRRQSSARALPSAKTEVVIAREDVVRMQQQQRHKQHRLSAENRKAPRQPCWHRNECEDDQNRSCADRHLRNHHTINSLKRRTCNQSKQQQQQQEPITQVDLHEPVATCTTNHQIAFVDDAIIEPNHMQVAQQKAVQHNSGCLPVATMIGTAATIHIATTTAAATAAAKDDTQSRSSACTQVCQQHLQRRQRRRWPSPMASQLLAAAFIACALMLNCARTTLCDVICPNDVSALLPCTCRNGTMGLLIKCSKSNLAIMSESLRHLNTLQERDSLPVEMLEIERSSVTRLFGPLFNDSQAYKFHFTLRELDVRDSQLRYIGSGSDNVAATLSQELRANLQFLMLDKNQLQQVPIELINNMTSLRALNLSTNAIGPQIESNSFVKLTNLTELDLSNNRLRVLVKGAFNSLTQLEWLSLASNDIAKLEKNLFSFGRKLRHLDLSNNKLTSLDRQDFNELTSLETLRLANNQLSSVPRSIFSRNAKLYVLDMSQNKLDDIDTYLFKSVRFLRDLNMSGNMIKEITKNTFSPTTRIKRINMSANQLTALAPETFKSLEWLEHVDLSHNQIVNISNDAFAHIFSVHIDLSHNKLTRIFYWAFHEVSNMTKLNLSHNLINDGISMIAFEQTDCAHLDLSHNLIEDISKVPVSNLTNIRVLDISHNQITEFNKKSFTQKTPLYELHTIDASHNNISQISGNILERLKSLRMLNVSHNSLRRLTSGALGNSPTLLELDLSHNNLVELVSGTLVGLVSLKTLDLTHNRLKKMIQIPVALNAIHLEHNEIGQLSKSAFPSLNSLLELYLDHNRLTHIDEGTFGTLLALRVLSMSHNQMTQVPVQALKDLNSLQTLQMSYNSLQRLPRRAFGTLPIVFELHLAHNNLSQVHDHAFDGCIQLIELDLSHNQLSELPGEAFAGLVSLRRLDLSHNQLTRFENKTRSAMEDLLSLEWANLSSNKLSMITPKTFLSNAYIPQKLTHLDLSNNLIGIIVNQAASGLRRVEWLSLRHNIINEIYPNVLGNATHLRHLDLSHNKLRALRDGTFDGQLSNLTSIYLNNNKLTSIRAREFDRLRSLSKLDLSSNRLERLLQEQTKWVRRGMILDMRHNAALECTCEMLPFVAWLNAIRARYQAYYAMLSPANVYSSSDSGGGVASNSSNVSSQQQQQQQQLQQQQQQALNATATMPASPDTGAEHSLGAITNAAASNPIATAAAAGSQTTMPANNDHQNLEHLSAYVNEMLMRSSPQWLRFAQQQQANDQRAIAHSQTAASTTNQFAKLRTVKSLLGQYLHANQLMSQTVCNKPDILAHKPLVHMLDVAVASDMNCDKLYLDEADAFTRLKAPVQYTSAEPHILDATGEQVVRVGWQLADPQLDLLNFVVVTTKFQQPFDLSYHRAALAARRAIGSSIDVDATLTTGSDNNNNNNKPMASAGVEFNLVEQQVVRVSYAERSVLLRGLDPEAFYVICATYESSDAHSSPASTVLMIDQRTSASSSSGGGLSAGGHLRPVRHNPHSQNVPNSQQQQQANKQSGDDVAHKARIFNSMFGDSARYNCADLKTLLNQDTQGERLVSGGAGSARLAAHSIMSRVRLSLVILATCVLILTQPRPRY